MAAKAYARTAAYDGAISNWLGAVAESADGIGGWLSADADGPVQEVARHALRRKPASARRVLCRRRRAARHHRRGARQLLGKELSYNNVADSDAALECVKAFADRPACVIVKHANPCGVAEADTLAAAYDRAYRTDPESAFGGIIAFNRELDAATAAMIVERQFVEVILAPSVTAKRRKRPSPPRRTCACW